MKNPFQVKDPRDYFDQVETHAVKRPIKRRKRQGNVRVDKAFEDHELLDEMTDRDDGEGYGD